MTYAWYGQGTRFLDISKPENPIQVAYYRPANGNVWASYLYKGYIYTADQGRGVDVLRFTRGAKAADREPQGGRRADAVGHAADLPPRAEQVVPAGPVRRVHLHAAQLGARTRRGPSCRAPAAAHAPCDSQGAMSEICCRGRRRPARARPATRSR